MTRILVLGANGQLARNTIPFLLEHDEARCDKNAHASEINDRGICFHHSK